MEYISGVGSTTLEMFSAIAGRFLSSPTRSRSNSELREETSTPVIAQTSAPVVLTSPQTANRKFFLHLLSFADLDYILLQHTVS